MKSITWPPPIEIRKHPLAKQVKLKCDLKRGLVAVIPKRFNLKNLPSLLERNRSWIEKQLLRLENHRSTTQRVLPTKICFRSIEETWQVGYDYSKAEFMLVMRPHQEIVVVGNVENKEACFVLLEKWIKQTAKKHLTKLLQTISLETGLSYQKVSFRNQTTRWGSCSSTKSISLNYKLIFLPYVLTRHIMLHELCHTRFLNHSAFFWELLKTFDEQYLENKISLRRGNQFIPDWIQ